MTKHHETKVDELRQALKKKKQVENKQEEHKVKEKSDISKLTENLNCAKKEAKEHYDKLLRVMAEFENYKKRVLKEQIDSRKYANEKIITELLPVLDDLDRAIEHLEQNKSNEAASFIQAINLVKKTFLNTLNKFGMQEIEVDEQSFNPNLHEALSCIPSKEHKDDDIIAVHRKGYKLGDRVIRAAQVTVVKNIDN